MSFFEYSLLIDADPVEVDRLPEDIVFGKLDLLDDDDEDDFSAILRFPDEFDFCNEAYPLDFFAEDPLLPLGLEDEVDADVVLPELPSLEDDEDSFVRVLLIVIFIPSELGLTIYSELLVERDNGCGEGDEPEGFDLDTVLLFDVFMSCFIEEIVAGVLSLFGFMVVIVTLFDELDKFGDLLNETGGVALVGERLSSDTFCADFSLSITALRAEPFLFRVGLFEGFVKSVGDD